MAEQTTQNATPILPGKYSNYVQALNTQLLQQTPQLSYTPRSEAQLRDNLETAYKSGYDQSVSNRQQATRENRAAIDADAAARGIGSSTWVTDAKMRQNDKEARDLSTLSATKNSTIAQQLSSALSDQENKKMTVDQFNASQKAQALSNALSVVSNMYDTFKSEDTSGAGASVGGGGGYGGGGYDGGGGNPKPKPTDKNPKDMGAGLPNGGSMASIRYYDKVNAKR